MPSFVINNLTAPDNYTVASTLDLLPICDHVNIDVFNGGIYWTVKEARTPWGVERQGDWNVEVFMAPGSRTIYNRGDGIIGFKVRAAVPASQIVAPAIQAQFTVEVVQ